MPGGGAEGAVERVGGTTPAESAQNISTARATGSVSSGNSKYSELVRGYRESTIVTSTRKTHEVDAPGVNPSTPENCREGIASRNSWRISSTAQYFSNR